MNVIVLATKSSIKKDLLDIVHELLPTRGGGFDGKESSIRDSVGQNMIVKVKASTIPSQGGEDAGDHHNVTGSQTLRTSARDDNSVRLNVLISLDACETSIDSALIG